MSTLSLKAKMRVRTAVRDYQDMFPEDYKVLLKEVQYCRENLKTEFAEMPDTRGGQDMRLLFITDERLNTMIGMKLTNDELLDFRDKVNTRWFAKEYPQFAISKAV